MGENGSEFGTLQLLVGRKENQLEDKNEENFDRLERELLNIKV